MHMPKLRRTIASETSHRTCRLFEEVVNLQKSRLSDLVFREDLNPKTKCCHLRWWQESEFGQVIRIIPLFRKALIQLQEQANPSGFHVRVYNIKHIPKYKQPSPHQSLHLFSLHRISSALFYPYFQTIESILAQSSKTDCCVRVFHLFQRPKRRPVLSMSKLSNEKIHMQYR